MRLFGTGAAVMFKGSGFYETDYRSESYKKAAKADQEAGKPSDAATKPSDARQADRYDRQERRVRRRVVVFRGKRQEKWNEKTQVRGLTGR